MVSRGTAERVDYRRSGGRLRAFSGIARIYPQPGAKLRDLGALRLSAGRVEGEVPQRHGTATGGVRLEAARGDVARSEEARLDGDLLTTESRVSARGPGYRVESNGLSARTDGSAIQFTRGVTGQLEVQR